MELDKTTCCTDMSFTVALVTCTTLLKSVFIY
jgi:hypothetical protein